MADRESRSGRAYFDAAILEWTARVHAGHDAALARAFDAPERYGMPAIQLGPSEARLVELLVRLAGARKAVEIGTLAGYSAIRIARALQEDGHLWSVEFDPKHAKVARENLANAGLASRVTVVEGAGLDVLPSLEAHGPFDAVFVDADKANYDAYGRWAARNLRPGGLLIGDNAFLFGRLLEDSAEAAAMRRFHEEAARAFDTACIPAPDGLLVGVRR
jgi:caffeoyl-CoA O-methyltransferase